MHVSNPARHNLRCQSSFFEFFRDGKWVYNKRVVCYLAVDIEKQRNNDTHN